MKALSIHQPWAWAILHAGKTVENRTWRTAYRGPLLVHASKSRASYDRVRGGWEEAFGHPLPAWESLAKGAIAGVVDVVDCVPAERAEATPWVEGPWCWVLANPRAFDVPIPFRGAQLIFKVPDDVVKNPPIAVAVSDRPSRF